MVAKTPEINHSVPNFDNMPPVPEVFNLAESANMDHRVDVETGREYLRIGDGVPYPRDVPADDPLARVLLDPVDSDEKGVILALPEEYISFQHVLNEATGAGVGYMGSTAPQAAGRLAFERVFEELGETVATLAKERRLVPAYIRYSRLIIDQTEEGARLRMLPRAEFVTTPGRSAGERALLEARSTLRSGLFTGASSVVQRTLTQIGIDAYDASVLKVIP